MALVCFTRGDIQLWVDRTWLCTLCCGCDWTLLIYGSGADENIIVMKAFIYVVWFQNNTNKNLYTLFNWSLSDVRVCRQGSQSDEAWRSRTTSVLLSATGGGGAGQSLWVPSWWLLHSPVKIQVADPLTVGVLTHAVWVPSESQVYITGCWYVSISSLL